MASGLVVMVMQLAFHLTNLAQANRCSRRKIPLGSFPLGLLDGSSSKRVASSSTSERAFVLMQLKATRNVSEALVRFFLMITSVRQEGGGGHTNQG